MTTNLKALLENKTLLLDTNILAYSYRYPKEFAGFWKELNNFPVDTAGIPHLDIELFKGTRGPLELKKKADFLKKYIKKTFELTPEVIRNAKLLSLCSSHETKSGDITDLFLGGVLKEQGNNCILMTANTNDFPETIYDWLEILNFPVPTRIINCILVRYSEVKFAKYIASFKQRKI